MAMVIEDRDQDIDPDLVSGSCMGMGVMFPQIWDVAKRYILRGDEFYQDGGLSILASWAWNLPLQEAADVLEAYFRKHEYFPEAPNRGGIALAPLQAAYTVAITPGWDDSTLPERRSRMIRLLERCLEVAASRYPPGDRAAVEATGDRGVIEETIEAIRVPHAGYVPAYAKQPDELERREPSEADAQMLEPVTPAAIGDEGIKESVDRAIASLREELQPAVLSPMDLVVAKHGHEMLEQRITLIEKATNQRLDDLSKSVDRYLAGEQLHSGRREVALAKWAIVIAVVTGIASVGLAVLTTFIAPRLGSLLTPPG